MEDDVVIKSFSDPKVQVIFQRALDEAINPNLDEIRRIAGYGDVAAVVFEPGPLNVAGAKALGWDGRSPVFRLSPKKQAKIADADAATAKWIARQGGPMRIFLILQGGTFLVNYGDRKIWIEPGSTDTERKQSAS